VLFSLYFNSARGQTAGPILTINISKSVSARNAFLYGLEQHITILEVKLPKNRQHSHFSQNAKLLQQQYLLMYKSDQVKI